MHRRVQRLRTVANKMSHHPHDIDDIRLRIGDFLRRAAVFLKRFQVAETGLQFFVIFRDGPRQEPAQFARVVGVLGRINRREFVRVRRPFPRDVRDQIVTHQRQRLRRQAVKLQILQINVMVRSVEMSQRQIPHVSPTVGFAPEKCNAVLERGRQREPAEIRRQRRQRQFIDGVMPFVVPSADIEGAGAEHSGKRE